MDWRLLPTHLCDQAITLGGEPAWPLAAARAVIEFLREHGMAVLGVEVWIPDGDAPRVLGWSEYVTESAEDWEEYVRENASRALAELDRAEHSEGVPDHALFNLTWIDRSQRRAERT